MMFTDVEFRYRMLPLQILFSVSMAFIFNVKHFHVKHLLLKKFTKEADVPCRFATTLMAPTMELLLLMEVLSVIC